MSGLDQEFSAILQDFAKQSISGEPSVENLAATGLEQTPVEQPVVESNAPTAAAVSTPAAPTVEVKTEVKEDGPFADWDSPSETPQATPGVTTPNALPAEVFSELGKALGLEKVQGKEDVVAAISALKAEADKVKADRTQIHPELQKAIELNQKGGDFYEYLKVTSADYSKADPVTLYEDYVIEQFADAQGQVDEDKINNFLDNLPSEEKELRGRELQRRLVNEQARRVAEIENDANMRKQKHDAELKAALGGLTEVDGFKVDDSHRRDLFDWVTGKMMKDLFYGADGNLDPQKVARVAFRNKYHEKLDSYYKSKIRNTTKREILAEVTNAQITSPAISANPTPNKGYGINEYINSLEQKFNNK
jgi:hypothetical protein